MANTLYPLGAEKMLTAQINFLDDTIKAVLVPSTYTYSASHEFITDLGLTLSAAQTLSGKTVAAGAFDADDITFPSVATGATIKAVVLYRDSGVSATSPLLAYYDVLTGFPAITNGGNQSITWSNDVAKIFKL